MNRSLRVYHLKTVFIRPEMNLMTLKSIKHTRTHITTHISTKPQTFFITVKIFFYTKFTPKRPRRRPPYKMPWRMVLERLSWRVTCPNHASFRLLTVTRRASFGSTGELILLRTQSFVLWSRLEMRRRSFLQALGFEGLDPFLRVSKQGPCFIAIEEDGGGIGLFELSETKPITSLRKLPATIDRSCPLSHCFVVLVCDNHLFVF